MKKTICHVLVFAMLLALFASVMPAFRLNAVGSYTFDFNRDSPVVVIDAQFIAEKNGATHFNIPSGVFSVTVIGNIDVTLIFTEDTTIDRSADTQSSLSQYADELKEAGMRLAEIDDSWKYGNGQYYVPTSPFRITGGARVRVSFAGKTVICAGYNGWVGDGSSVRNVHNTNSNPYYCGYAAIQVDGDSSLTIDSAAQGLEAYGSHPLAGQRVSNTTYPPNPLYVNPYFNAYYDGTKRVSLSGQEYILPPNVTENQNGGGAGIGGGASHTSTTAAEGNHGYVAGTPGEIIINSGNITAVGGHKAAGIGGGINGSATTSLIEINGGTITAIGGRWACGIGDGDSIPKYETSEFLKEKQIVINGGTVDAYGGTAAAAIGTTDEIYRNYNSNIHGLIITINGGTVTARSGESKGGAQTATAAIGAGFETNMRDNSITISSKATVSASSFSKYAISNCGTDVDAIPSVNIDPDGYMYLARFDTAYVANDKNREFVCYHVKADAKGNPMLLSLNAADINNFNEETYTGLYYALNRTNKRYYLVKADGTPWTKEDAMQANLTNYEVDLTDGLVYPATIPNLSYYYLKDKIVETYSVPAQYKAIAMTLPDPTLVSVSGTYILRVPDNQASDSLTDDTYVVIQKPTAGTGSGLINASNKTHVTQGNNDGTVKLTPNILEDAVAKELISLSVVYGGEELIKKYHGRFYPTTYAYTVYLPRKNGAAINFDLSFTYDKENVENIDIIIGGQNDSDTALIGSYKNTYTLGAGDEKMEIWIKKTDKQEGQSSPPSVIYKVTVIRKPLYVLEMKPMSKVYDGEAVKAVVEHMYIPGEGLSGDYGVTEFSDDEIIGGTVSVRYNGNSVVDVDSGHVTVEEESFSNSDFYYQRNKKTSVEIQYDIVHTQQLGEFLVNTYITSGSKTILVSVQVDLPNKKITIPTVDADGNLSESIGNFTVVRNSTDTSATLVLKGTSNSYQYTILELRIDNDGYSGGNTLTEEEIVANLQAEVDKALLEMKESLEESHWTMASKPITYDKGSINATARFTMSVPTGIKSSGQRYSTTLSDARPLDYSVVGSKLVGSALVTATYDHDVDMTSLLSAEDMANIKYEYHIASTGDVGSGAELDGPPSDAGTYHVRATLEADTFEAEGVDEFVIERRVIHITGVKNWRTYLSETQVTEIAKNNTAFLEVKNYESFVFDNLVDKDEGRIAVEMLPNTKLNAGITSAVVYYEDGAQLQISYTPTKILILPVRLDETDAVTKNYRFPDAQISNWYTPENTEGGYTWYRFAVPGELSYVVDDAMFKKDIIGGEMTDWQKYWPDGADDPLQWETDDQGNIGPAEGETRIDYHSPSSSEHREYIYMHTVNEGENRARYAVDIEYGALQYTYSKTVWDVNKHEYVSVTEESYWSGNEGINNRITIYNRSNREIYYSAEATLDEYFGAGCEVYLSLSAEKPTDGSATRSLVNIMVQRTEENADEAMKESFYVYLDGIPQISSPNDGLRSTGKVIVTVASTRQETQNE